MPTIFTKIINGEIPSYKIAEDSDFYAFLDINPIQKGHTLIVPKSEVDYFFDLEDENIAGMMLFAKKVAAKIKSATKCNRVAVMVLGMEVPHAHIHLIPIQTESDIDFSRDKLTLTKEEFTDIQNRVVNSL